MGFIIFIIIFIIVPILIRKKNEDAKSKNGAPKNAPQTPSRVAAPSGAARRNMPESSTEEYGREEAPERTRAIFDGEGYDSGAVYDGVRKKRR